jgi:SAM-dependent methyltransferase
MSEKYDKVIAGHYSAYRPPLHKMILEKIIPIDEKFGKGLDIGCGTGYSAIALTNYCSHVYGIEPSDSMLKAAVLDEKITYLKGSGDSLPILNKSINIVTFAGSLFYAKSAALLKELHRVCLDKSAIIIYDFMVLLDDILNHFNIARNKSISNYDYQVNLNDNIDFNKIIAHKEQINITIAADNLAHILLGDSNIYNGFVNKFNVTDPFPMLVNELQTVSQKWTLKVNINFSKYQINTSENGAKK